jgi:Dolichyl-phosphate-mannose-protein mannosyltransferase
MTRGGGEQIETAPPHGRWMIPCLILISVVVHGGIISNTSVTARDSVGFARYALNLIDPNAGRPESTSRSLLTVLREEKHPPGYPALVAAVSPVVRRFDPAPLADQMLRSTQVASALAAVLLVLPSFWLARQLFDRTVGFWAVLLFQVLPVAARDTSDGLSDGPFLLFATTALAVGVRAVCAGGTRWHCVACGAVAGLAYLVRPEGVVLPVAAACTLCLGVLGRRVRLAVAAGQLLAVAVGFLAVGGPYMAVIGGITNKPAMNKPVAVASLSPPRGATPLFAEVLPTDVQGVQRIGSAAGAIGREWLKVAHYGVAVFAVIGLTMTARRVRTEPKFWLPLVYVAGHLLVLVILGFKQGYVSERHLLPVTFVGVVFAVGGLPAWFRLWTRIPGIGPVFAWRHWPTVTTLGLMASCLPPLMKSLHDNRLGHKLAGVKLASELDRLSATDPQALAGVVVIDHYEWAQFFAGRSYHRIPADPPVEWQRVVYAVLELKDGRPEAAAFHSDRHRAAVDLFSDPANPPEWVYWWPEDGPRESARVVLLKQVRR